MVDVDIAEVSALLADTAPFAVLPRRDLDRLGARLTIRYARRGTALMTVGRANDEVFVVRSGAIQITDDSGELVARGGEGALLLVMPGAVFHEVSKAHAPVAQFFSDQRQGWAGSAPPRCGHRAAGARPRARPSRRSSSRPPDGRLATPPAGRGLREHRTRPAPRPHRLSRLRPCRRTRDPARRCRPAAVPHGGRGRRERDRARHH